MVHWLDARGILFCAVPNGQLRSKRVGAQLKREGTRSGVPDILVFTPAPRFPNFRGIAIEMKRVQGRKPTDNQLRWLKNLDRVGWYSAVCEGHEEAIQVLESLGW